MVFLFRNRTIKKSPKDLAMQSEVFLQIEMPTLKALAEDKWRDEEE